MLSDLFRKYPYLFWPETNKASLIACQSCHLMPVECNLSHKKLCFLHKHEWIYILLLQFSWFSVRFRWHRVDALARVWSHDTASSHPWCELFAAAGVGERCWNSQWGWIDFESSWDFRGDRGGTNCHDDMPDTQEKINFGLGRQKEQHLLISNTSRAAKKYEERAPSQYHYVGRNPGNASSRSSHRLRLVLIILIEVNNDFRLISPTW